MKSGEDMKHESFLAQNQVFSQLDADELKQLQGQAKIRQFQGGEWIAYHGDVWPNLFLILKGQVIAIKESTEGRSLTLAAFDEGEIFWGLAFFMRTLPCPPHSRHPMIVNS